MSKGSGRNILTIVFAAVAAVLLTVLILILAGVIPLSGSGSSSGSSTGTSSAGTSTTGTSIFIEDVSSQTSHTHIWATANCTRPATCTICGATQGSATGHFWTPATCTAPATCSVCGATQGSELGHTWKAATANTPRTCTACGLTEGAPAFEPSKGEPAAPQYSKYKDPDGAVDLFTENYNYTEEYTVQVAHSQYLSSCETAVKRLRKAGYNAFLYEQLDKTGYCIMIGVFSSKEEADDFAVYLHSQPAVKGVKLDCAYACHKARISSATVSRYTNPWW